MITCSSDSVKEEPGQKTGPMSGIRQSSPQNRRGAAVITVEKSVLFSSLREFQIRSAPQAAEVERRHLQLESEKPQKTLHSFNQEHKEKRK